MDIARHWRLKGQRYNLIGTICLNCGKTFFMPRPVCDSCNAPVPGTYALENRHVRRSQVSAVVEPAQR